LAQAKSDCALLWNGTLSFSSFMVANSTMRPVGGAWAVHRQHHVSCNNNNSKAGCTPFSSSSHF